MNAWEILILIAAQLAIVLLAASIFFALRKGRGKPKPPGVEAELERLRDEIWELRAAADARDRAEAASLAKSRFLATVSHEIRTPLNGVMGLAQLLAMTRLDAEQASYVEAINDSSRSLAQLIDDILDFSKIEAGKLELRRERFALAPLVEGVVELLAPRAFAKGLEIASVIAPEVPREIEGDPSRLRQVLVNLVGNAVNFTEKGGVGLRLSRVDDMLRFEVRDTGPGVPEKAREAIFEEFEQGDGSATRRHGGTGLGLAISRRLVAQMGGALALAQTSAKGSTFAFTLPAPAGAPMAATLAGLDVLIVGASRFEAPYLAESLRSAGARAAVAESESAALGDLDLARGLDAARGLGAVIVDCALGAELTARLAAAARKAGARRLFLLFSPLERHAFGEAALRDFDGWLVKPVRSASLISRLSQGLRPLAVDAPKAAAAEPVQSLAGLKALVAEDNDVNALILTRHLGKLGAEAARARNGAEAVAMAEADSYDVIIMDLFMPELDGREATRRIREGEARARGPRTPILALTASAQEEDERAARAAGVDAFLTKPVDFAALAVTIEELRLAPRGSERRGALYAQEPNGLSAPNRPMR